MKKRSKRGSCKSTCTSKNVNCIHVLLKSHYIYKYNNRNENILFITLLKFDIASICIIA